MKKAYSILAFILAVFMMVTLTACSGSPSNALHQSSNNPPNDTVTSTPEPTPEPLPSYSFEEIMIKEPTRFSDRNDKISVDVSGVKNYYGEITVGNRSYLSDFNSTLDGTYALFVVDEGTVPLRITIGDDGYASWFNLTGTVKGSDVEYNGSIYTHNSSPITQVKRNHEAEKQIKDISVLRVDWGKNKGSSEWNFVMLAVVITEAEAIRYVQDGTLPRCMQGLTVTGLDEIFGTSGREPGELDNIRAALSDFEIKAGDGEIIITKYTGTDTAVIIPDSVTSIGDSAFAENESLASVTIPDSVTSIGDSAFSRCSNLTSVSIGNGVTGIGSYAFSECVELIMLNIPDSVTNIGEGAFNNCKGLTSIILPKGMMGIGKRVFYACDSLTSVIIPDSVTSIGDSAFEGCRELTSITLPKGMTGIGKIAFQRCRNLISVTIPDSVKSIEMYAFRGCTSLDEATKQRVLEINLYARFN